MGFVGSSGGGSGNVKNALGSFRNLDRERENTMVELESSDETDEQR